MECSDRFRSMASAEAARFAFYTNAFAVVEDRFQNHLAFACMKTVLAVLAFFGETVDLLCYVDRGGFIHAASFAVSGVRASEPDFVPGGTPSDGRRPPDFGKEK